MYSNFRENLGSLLSFHMEKDKHWQVLNEFLISEWRRGTGEAGSSVAGCTPPSRCTAGCRAAPWGTVESVALAWKHIILYKLSGKLMLTPGSNCCHCFCSKNGILLTCRRIQSPQSTDSLLNACVRVRLLLFGPFARRHCVPCAGNEDKMSFVTRKHNLRTYSGFTWLALEHTQIARISMTDMMAGMAQNTRRNSSPTRSTQP